MTRIIIEPLRKTDRARWAELWRGYLAFYQATLPSETYDHSWERMMAADGAIRGLGARLGDPEAPLVGIAHYLFHPHAWSAREVCYLQDLFVDEAVRGAGCGAELIAAVAASARARGAFRLYWTTQENNLLARRLYDRVARFSGFLRYDYALDAPELMSHKPAPIKVPPAACP